MLAIPKAKNEIIVKLCLEEIEKFLVIIINIVSYWKHISIEVIVISKFYLINKYFLLKIHFSISSGFCCVIKDIYSERYSLYPIYFIVN